MNFNREGRGMVMKQKLLVAITLSLVLSGVTALQASAKDLQYPAPCFQGDELAKVREWEKTWVGQKISSGNVDQVKEFLPESFYNLMKDTARWGESSFEIVAYQTVSPPPGKIEFTRKYYGQTKVGSQGEILGYVSGVPFPDTKDGIEMAHNFRMQSFGDSMRNHDNAFIVDGRLKYDLNSEIMTNLCFFSGRTDTPPVPELTDNPKQIWRAFSMLQLQPPETRNMRIMEVHYKDTLKLYDSWFWMPSVRRIRRRSTSERQDAQGGADYCAYDNQGWDGPVNENTYKYLGEKDCLMVRHQDNTKLLHTPGDCVYDGTQRERVKVHVVEATSKDPNFLYSKMIWYLDPESWQMLFSDRYDRGGKLWKVLNQFGYVGKGYNNVGVANFNGTQTVDLQRIHSTIGTTEIEMGVDLPRDLFTLNWLQKHGY